MKDFFVGKRISFDGGRTWTTLMGGMQRTQVNVTSGSLTFSSKVGIDHSTGNFIVIHPNDLDQLTSFRSLDGGKTIEKFDVVTTLDDHIHEIGFMTDEWFLIQSTDSTREGGGGTFTVMSSTDNGVTWGQTALTTTSTKIGPFRGCYVNGDFYWVGQDGNGLGINRLRYLSGIGGSTFYDETGGATIIPKGVFTGRNSTELIYLYEDTVASHREVVFRIFDDVPTTTSNTVVKSAWTNIDTIAGFCVTGDNKFCIIDTSGDVYESLNLQTWIKVSSAGWDTPTLTDMIDLRAVT